MEGYLYDGWNPVMITQLDPTNPAAVPVRKWSCVWKPDVGSSFYARSSWQKAGGVGGLAWMQTGIAQTLADAAGGTLYGAAEVYVPMSDHMGNVRHYYQIKSTAVVSFPSTITGQVSASFEYDAFGREVRATGLKVPGNTAPPGSPPNNPPPGLVADTPYADALPFHFSTKFTDQESGLNYFGFRYYDPRDGRWLGRDPINEKGGLNLQGMLRNNTLTRWDFLGLLQELKLDDESFELGNCGAFKWEIDWRLIDDSATGGVIIQKVEVIPFIRSCKGKVASHMLSVIYPYWEAWPVDKLKRKANPPTGSPHDTLSISKGALSVGYVGSYGYVKWKVTADFYEGELIPGIMVPAPPKTHPAGDLPKSEIDPTPGLVGLSKPLTRTLEIGWNCCCEPPKGPGTRLKVKDPR